MTEADLIQEVKDEISHSASLPYNLNDQEIKRIIKRARAFFYDNYQYAVEDKIFILGKELFANPSFRATRQIQLPSCVRTVYDVSAFTLSAKSIEWWIRETFVQLIMQLHKEYDVIIYVSPEGIEIEDNGVRTTDSEYRDKIDKVIKEMLVEWTPVKLIEVKGTTEDRITTIKEALFS